MIDTEVLEVNNEGLVAIQNGDIKLIIPYDSVVLAIGAKPEKKLYAEVNGKFPNVYLAGDCNRCGLIIDAVSQAYETAYKI